MALREKLLIGQYVSVDSPVHRMNPSVKIMLLMVYMVLIFMIREVYGVAAAGFFITVAVLLSKITPGYLIRGLKPVLFLVFFTFILHLLFTPEGTEVYWSWGIIQVTREGLVRGAQIFIRLTMLVLAATLLTLTTSPIELTDGLETLLKPFACLGFPAHEFSMMMTIALRFIPVLLEELDRIMKAQKARGADFESGGLVKRARSLVPLLVPLFVSSFKRADELAQAMEVRCYRGGEGRTRMRIRSVSWRDAVATVMMLALATVLIALR